MYYSPSGYSAGSATNPGGVYPWQYSLLDVGNKETVVYQGFMNKDVAIAVNETGQPIANTTNEILDTWKPFYGQNPEWTNQFVLLYPVEFNSSQYAAWRVNSQGQWVRTFKVLDHLGSLRVDGLGYETQTSFDYKPFGGVEWSASTKQFEKAKSKDGFLGLQKDKESNLGDHGVRKYDSEIGRFLAIDPLWEKYNTLNPYQYSGNSPVMRLDLDGKQDFKFDNSNSTYFIGGKGMSDADKQTYQATFNEIIENGNDLISPLLNKRLSIGVGVVNSILNKTFDINTILDGNNSLTEEKRLGNDGEKAVVHGNSLKSMKPTWGYKLYTNENEFLKNGITSKILPETRYTKAFMQNHYMEYNPIPYTNRLEAYRWEYNENMTNPGPLNFERYIKR